MEVGERKVWTIRVFDNDYRSLAYTEDFVGSENEVKRILFGKFLEWSTLQLRSSLI